LKWESLDSINLLSYSFFHFYFDWDFNLEIIWIFKLLKMITVSFIYALFQSISWSFQSLTFQLYVLALTKNHVYQLSSEAALLHFLPAPFYLKLKTKDYWHHVNYLHQNLILLSCWLPVLFPFKLMLSNFYSSIQSFLFALSFFGHSFWISFQFCSRLHLVNLSEHISNWYIHKFLQLMFYLLSSWDASQILKQ
jgi:hypothetical protein